MTHRQEEAWREFLNEEMNRPSKECWYISQLTDVVDKLLTTDKNVRIDANRWKMEFQPVEGMSQRRQEPGYTRQQPEYSEEDVKTRADYQTNVILSAFGGLGAITVVKGKGKPPQ